MSPIECSMCAGNAVEHEEFHFPYTLRTGFVRRIVVCAGCQDIVRVVLSRKADLVAQLRSSRRSGVVVIDQVSFTQDAA